MKIVVDTSVLIDHLRGRSYLEDIIKTLDDENDLFLPSIVLFELFSGASTRQANIASRIYSLISKFTMVELTAEIARRAGELYRDNIHGLDAPDYIMAATTLEIGGVILTLNHKHFTRIPGLILYSS